MSGRREAGREKRDKKALSTPHQEEKHPFSSPLSFRAARSPTASLTRRVTFAAAHRYHRPEWTDERNQQVFGACANPHFHGNSYVCDVTVSGPIDDDTGMVVDLGKLDSALDREVRARFDHRNINLEVEEFGEGRLVPTGENLARFIFFKVRDQIGSDVAIERVVVREDESLWAEYSGRGS